jgi:hypothetical protein
MKNLRQEKSLRDHEPNLKGFAAIADRVSARRGNTFAELPILPGEIGSERRRDRTLPEANHPDPVGLALHGRHVSGAAAPAVPIAVVRPGTAKTGTAMSASRHPKGA